jgi:16S rRNA (uracil1498-N3)-methyltransferase
VTQVVVPDLAAEDLRLGGDEAHHLTRVLRLGVGDQFVLTDGEGGVAQAQIRALDRRGLDATVTRRARVEPPALRLWLAGDAEGARGDWLVEKAVELGIWAFVPVARAEARRIERWRRLARAALKQSLGAWALRLEAGPADAGWVAARNWSGLWIASPDGVDPLSEPIPAQGDWLLICGPPRGFAAAEEARLRALPGVRAVALGGSRLRAETAALALAVAARLRAGQIAQTS